MKDFDPLQPGPNYVSWPSEGREYNGWWRAISVSALIHKSWKAMKNYFYARK